MQACYNLYFFVLQSQDQILCRLVYLIIKDLNQNQDEAFIVISSLEKDINCSIDLFDANSMRVHSKVIINSSEHMSSSTLTVGIRVFDSNHEVIRR